MTNALLWTFHVVCTSCCILSTIYISVDFHKWRFYAAFNVYQKLILQRSLDSTKDYDRLSTDVQSRDSRIFALLDWRHNTAYTDFDGYPVGLVDKLCLQNFEQNKRRWGILLAE